MKFAIDDRRRQPRRALLSALVPAAVKIVHFPLQVCHWLRMMRLVIAMSASPHICRKKHTSIVAREHGRGETLRFVHGLILVQPRICMSSASSGPRLANHQR